MLCMCVYTGLQAVTNKFQKWNTDFNVELNHNILQKLSWLSKIKQLFISTEKCANS